VVSARLERVHRLVPYLTMLVCAALLVGCGGVDGESAPEPTLPRGLAADLAAQSDAIAEAYAAGDECGAAHGADALLDGVLLAIEEGRVPGVFQESLTATANKLVDRINCPEEAPPPEEDQGADCDELEAQKQALEEGKEDKKGKGKAKGRDRAFEEQIEALEQEIEACKEDVEGEGDEEDD
jgi:hypothetical protein